MKDGSGNEVSLEALYETLRTKDVDTLMEELEELIVRKDTECELLLAYDKILDEKDPIVPQYGSPEDLKKLKWRLGIPWEQDDPVPEPPAAAAVAQARPRARSRWKRPVLIAAVLILLLALAAGASKIPFFQMAWNWTDEAFSVAPKPGNIQLQEATEEGFYSIQDALDFYKIPDKVAPTWIPNDLSLHMLDIIQVDDFMFITAQYTGNGKVVNIRIQYDSNLTTMSEWEDEPSAEVYEKNGTVYHITGNENQYTVTWETDYCLCRIAGDMTENELKQVINSIDEE